MPSSRTVSFMVSSTGCELRSLFTRDRITSPGCDASDANTACWRVCGLGVGISWVGGVSIGPRPHDATPRSDAESTYRDHGRAEGDEPLAEAALVGVEEGGGGVPRVEGPGDELEAAELHDGVGQLLGQDGRHALEDRPGALALHQPRDALQRARRKARVRHQPDARRLGALWGGCVGEVRYRGQSVRRGRVGGPHTRSHAADMPLTSRGQSAVEAMKSAMMEASAKVTKMEAAGSQPLTTVLNMA